MWLLAGTLDRINTNLMTKEEIESLTREIEAISRNFESEPCTEDVRMLKSDFDIATIWEPQRYLEFIHAAAEILRQARVLFLHAALNRVCEKEKVAYRFRTPYRANMAYSAVMKNEGAFYILDEDGHYREIFDSEKFAGFIENEFWEILDK